MRVAVNSHALEYCLTTMHLWNYSRRSVNLTTLFSWASLTCLRKFVKVMMLLCGGFWFINTETKKYLALMISNENIPQETSKRSGTVNVLKFQTIFSLCSQIKCVGYQGWNTQQNSKQTRPWSDCFFRGSLSLVWVNNFWQAKFNCFFLEILKKSLKKSSENDQLTGHFQSFFFIPLRP